MFIISIGNKITGSVNIIEVYYLDYKGSNLHFN